MAQHRDRALVGLDSAPLELQPEARARAEARTERETYAPRDAIDAVLIALHRAGTVRAMLRLDRDEEKRLFAYSIIYLFVLFALLVVDHVLVAQGMLA